MKICMAAEYYPPHIGGGEILLAGLAQGLAARGHSVRVVTCRVPGTPAREMLNGVEVIRAPVPRRLDRLSFPLLGLAAVMRAAREADVIHTATYTGAPAAWLAGRRFGRPVILTPHEVLGKWWFALGLPPLAAWSAWLAERLVLSLPFDAYACNSQSTLAGLKSVGAPAGKAFIAYPGLDHERFNPDRCGAEARTDLRKRLGLSDSDRAVLCYGRPGLLKGMETLAAAVPRIKKALPEFKLIWILSPKPARGRRRVLRILEKAPREAVILLPTVSSEALPGYLHAADCVVVPSLSEGFGFCCVEACAMEKPVAASRAGSLPEVVSGKHALFNPGDPAALARGVAALLSGQHEFLPPKKFSWEACVDKHLEVYEKLRR